jgi:hypothetical protein
MKTCSDCAEALSELTQPCPACGSSSQSAAIQATAAVGVAAAVGPGLSLTFNPDQPWYSQWYKVKQSLTTIEDTCRPESYRGNDPVKHAIENFFTNCLDMGDWLWNDPSTGLSQTRVHNFIDNNPNLQICNGMANTTKHRIRKYSENITARIQSVTPGPNGTKVVIEWSQGPNTHIEDALDLARRCVAAWEGYLRANGLQSPI